MPRPPGTTTLSAGARPLLLLPRIWRRLSRPPRAPLILHARRRHMRIAICNHDAMRGGIQVGGRCVRRRGRRRRAGCGRRWGTSLRPRPRPRSSFLPSPHHAPIRLPCPSRDQRRGGRACAVSGSRA
ncbi:hypothetical protein DFH09DRAFT_1381897, partial [Mycena vulgaris]